MVDCPLPQGTHHVSGGGARHRHGERREHHTPGTQRQCRLQIILGHCKIMMIMMIMMIMASIQGLKHVCFSHIFPPAVY